MNQLNKNLPQSEISVLFLVYEFYPIKVVISQTVLGFYVTLFGRDGNNAVSFIVLYFGICSVHPHCCI